MDAVEVADRDHGRQGEGVEFGEGAGDLHQAISKFSLRPSWASRI
jgi:hypothetical protein